MIALVAALVLNAAPVLQPDPGGYKRLQPRQLDASSFLANGWNKFEQNYLPIYAADDDAATAWVEGAKGPGVGESLTWLGPPLSKAHAFRIFIRSGYQKSKALFLANARPRRIRIQPLVISGEERLPAPAGHALELELADAPGWQKAELPVPANVSGFQLTVLSVYDGTQYQDLCISDVQVYVGADDVYSAAAEAQAAERIRAFVAERKAAAAAGALSAVELAPRYKAVKLGELKFEKSGVAKLADALAVKAPAALTPVLAQARAAASFYSEGIASKKLTRRPAKLASTAKGLGSRATSLSAAVSGDRSLLVMLRYLALGDLAAFESTGDKVVDPEKDRQALVKRLMLSPHDACRQGCERQVKKTQAADLFRCFATPAGAGDGDRHEVTSCKELCSGDVVFAAAMCDDGDSMTETRGMYVLGDLEAPTAVFRHAQVDTGGRMFDSSDIADDLVTYDRGLARDLVSVRVSTGEGDDGDTTKLAGAVYLFAWNREGKRPKLASVTRVLVGDGFVVVTRFESA